MTHEVIVAYDVLRDHRKRAEYHNIANYSKGWLSIARWKSIFFTECETEEQKNKYRKRLAMMAASFGVGIGGLILTVSTAGAAAPVVVGACGTLGAGCLGGGLQSFFRTINPKSIEKGCDFKDFAKSFGFGFVGGAVTGGAGVGITARIAGIGSAATQASAATVPQLIGIGVASGSVGGVVFSVAADAEKKFVDGHSVTYKQLVGHAAAGLFIGATTGIAVGAVSSTVAGFSSATNIEGKILSKFTRYSSLLKRNLAKGFTIKSTESVTGSVSGFIEERLDDGMNNRLISEHIKESGTNLVASVLKDAAIGVVSTTARYVSNEKKVSREVLQNRNTDGKIADNFADVDATYRNVNLDISENLSFDSSDSNSKLQTNERQGIRYHLDQQSVLTSGDTNVKAKYNPPSGVSGVNSGNVNRVNSRSYGKKIDGFVLENNTIITHARFKYIPKVLLKSTMIVEFEVKGLVKTQETSESEQAIEIPIAAENVKVSFKVRRFFGVWCDVKKWDRYRQKWYKKPHIFTYDCPHEQRTFTLDGLLFYEGVTQITDERHDDVDDV